MSISDIVRRTKAPAESGAHHLLSREPRVSLLPPELRAAEGVRAIRRRLIAGVVGAAVLVAAGITVSAGVELTSQVRLFVASGRTADLSKQISGYQALSQLQNRIALTKAAERVGSSTAVDWNAYLRRIDAVTPSSFDITSTAINAASPIAAYAQGTSSIDVARVGTIVLTASTDSLDDLPAWLTGLATLPGYGDALPQTSTATAAGGYTVIVTMHITDGAYATPLTQGVPK